MVKLIPDKVNPKKVMKEWLTEQFNKRIKQPIANKTEELENQASQKWNEYSGKAREQANKSFDYYKKQDAFYRGLFWLAVALLILLWIISGS